MEHDEAIKNYRRLVEALEKAKKSAFQTMCELEEQLDAMQTLELEMEQLKGKLIQMVGEKDIEVNKLRDELEEKIVELEYMEELNMNLSVTERKSHDEFREVRKALIGVLSCEPLKCEGQTMIGHKRMVSIDYEPFWKACRKAFAEDEA